MKARILAASLALFTLCGLAVAAEYCVTANRRINLRDAASLRGAVLETVTPGTTLSVSGEYNRWLKINRNGREAWMANWVDYSRLENCGGTNPQPGTPTEPSNIDNCCFVDRQCSSDQEWTDGYWAFQNGQCAAPAGSVTPASSQPVSVSPVQIEGSEAFVNVVSETLNLMQSKVPEFYQYIVSVTSVIAEHGPDRCDWGVAYVGTGRTSLGSCLVGGQMPQPLYVVAAYLAHEACHHHGHDINAETGEFDHQPCYKAGHDAYAAISA